MEYLWRDILNTIFYLLRAGCQWRQLPHDLVKWWVAYRWFRTLNRDGTWRTIHDELHRAVRAADGRADESTACSLDAQSVASAEGGAGGGQRDGRVASRHGVGERESTVRVDRTGDRGCPQRV